MNPDCKAAALFAHVRLWLALNSSSARQIAGGGSAPAQTPIDRRQVSLRTTRTVNVQYREVHRARESSV